MTETRRDRPCRHVGSGRRRLHRFSSRRRMSRRLRQKTSRRPRTLCRPVSRGMAAAVGAGRCPTPSADKAADSSVTLSTGADVEVHFGFAGGGDAASQATAKMGISVTTTPAVSCGRWSDYRPTALTGINKGNDRSTGHGDNSRQIRLRVLLSQTAVDRSGFGPRRLRQGDSRHCQGQLRARGRRNANPRHLQGPARDPEGGRRGLCHEARRRLDTQDSGRPQDHDVHRGVVRASTRTSRWLWQPLSEAPSPSP